MTTDPADRVSRILEAANKGEAEATEQLFEFVYAELHRMAQREMRGEGPGHTLQTTALVNEAYLRLVKTDARQWENRRHFFGAAARAMRQILVESARKRNTQRRGGGVSHVTLKSNVPGDEPSIDVLALDQALARLEELHQRAAQVVSHRYFLGMTLEETADALHVARRTVDSDWQFAKMWLKRELDGSDT